MNPFKAEESDKTPYCREWGLLCAITTAIVLFVVNEPPFGVILLAALVGYGGGVVVGWLMWGLFFEPLVEARKRGQGPV
jgi:hypothetical protein